MSENAIKPSRKENYPEWYQQVIKAADLAENSVVRGCMVIKPWGYGIWERIQKVLDQKIKDTGHENAYFPLFIPLSFLEKEAKHVEGFAKECAVVTHHRLEVKDGKLLPAGQLEEPYVVRPTSETIIGESFSNWVQSYRDLPLLINQWANVVRWEMRPRMFLRTAEFLWQEGHTVHATASEAQAEVQQMIKIYQEFIENYLAIPVILGEKPESERFAGAEQTFTVEAMMQDGKALQAGTSHYLGQNFAKSSEIKFLDQQGVLDYAYTTSWGVSSRLIGGLIMVHSDDDGLRLPPKIASKQVVILPVIPKVELSDQVNQYVEKIKFALQKASYNQEAVRFTVDQRDLRGGEKNWQWIKKGIPLRIEAGPKDVEANTVVIYRRDRGVKEKLFVKLEDLTSEIEKLLNDIQENLFNIAKTFRDAKIRKDLKTLAEFQAFFKNDHYDSQGFVLAPWSCDPKSEEVLNDLKVTIRCLPVDLTLASDTCILTGLPAKRMALFGKAY